MSRSCLTLEGAMLAGLMTTQSGNVFSDFASAEPMSVGAVPWPDGSKLTLIVKLTLTVDSTGAVRVLKPGRPLSLDDADTDAELYYPSDFAPQKPRCDVI